MTSHHETSHCHHIVIETRAHTGAERKRCQEQCTFHVRIHVHVLRSFCMCCVCVTCMTLSFIAFAVIRPSTAAYVACRDSKIEVRDCWNRELTHNTTHTKGRKYHGCRKEAFRSQIIIIIIIYDKTNVSYVLCLVSVCLSVCCVAVLMYRYADAFLTGALLL